MMPPPGALLPPAQSFDIRRNSGPGSQRELGAQVSARDLPRTRPPPRNTPAAGESGARPDNESYPIRVYPLRSAAALPNPLDSRAHDRCVHAVPGASVASCRSLHRLRCLPPPVDGIHAPSVCRQDGVCPVDVGSRVGAPGCSGPCAFQSSAPALPPCGKTGAGEEAAGTAGRGGRTERIRRGCTSRCHSLHLPPWWYRLSSPSGGRTRSRDKRVRVPALQPPQVFELS